MLDHETQHTCSQTVVLYYQSTNICEGAQPSEKDNPRTTSPTGRLTASSWDIERSLFSSPTGPLLQEHKQICSSSSPSFLLSLHLYVGRELMDSTVAPLVLERSSRMPSTEIIQGRQQNTVAQRRNGSAYPIQLKVRKTIHNLHKESKNNWLTIGI